jgi:hypothetical protein
MYVDDIESQVVARQGKHNHEWTQIDANFWEHDRPGRCGVRLAPRSGKNDTNSNVFGGDANGDGRDDLPTESDFRAFASLRVHSRLATPLLDIHNWLTQVVDFPDFCRYFRPVFMDTFHAFFFAEKNSSRFCARRVFTKMGTFSLHQGNAHATICESYREDR